MEIGDLYSENCPCVMGGVTAGDKGEARGATNMGGFAGGMIVEFPPLVDYAQGTYHLVFETLSKDGHTQLYGEQAVLNIASGAGGLNVEPGGPGCIFPFVHAADRQLKLYVLHYPGDNQPRRWRILRTGVYY